MARMSEHFGSDFPRARQGVLSEGRTWKLQVPSWRHCRTWCVLTVIRPAGVQKVISVRSEGHVQDTPAYVPGLDAFEFMEAAIPTVVQSDCLIWRVDFRQNYGLFSL